VDSANFLRRLTLLLGLVSTACAQGTNEENALPTGADESFVASDAGTGEDESPDAATPPSGSSSGSSGSGGVADDELNEILDKAGVPR